MARAAIIAAAGAAAAGVLVVTAAVLAPQVPVAEAQVVYMAAAVAETGLAEQVGVMVLMAQSASSGPVVRAHSHRQIQGTYNAKLFRRMDALPAVSGSRSGAVACGTRCAYDWHGDSGFNYVRICAVHGSRLRWRASYDYRLYRHVHTGMHHRYSGIISHHR